MSSLRSELIRTLIDGSQKQKGRLMLEGRSPIEVRSSVERLWDSEARAGLLLGSVKISRKTQHVMPFSPTTWRARISPV